LLSFTRSSIPVVYAEILRRLIEILWLILRGLSMRVFAKVVHLLFRILLSLGSIFPGCHLMVISSEAIDDS